MCEYKPPSDPTLPPFNADSEDFTSAQILNPGLINPRHAPQSAGPFRTSFNTVPPRSSDSSASTPSQRHSYIQRGHHRNFSFAGGHSRRKSLSTPFMHSSSSHSPRTDPHTPMLSSTRPWTTDATKHGIEQHDTFPTPQNPPIIPGQSINSYSRRPAPPKNLSIFPSLVSLSATSEDGSQEIEYSNGAGSVESAPSSAVSNQPGQLQASFMFGPSMSSANSPATSASTESRRATRRGHHHKHSLSHNFFSFLEPGGDLTHMRTPRSPEPRNQLASTSTSSSPWHNTSSSEKTSFPLSSRQVSFNTSDPFLNAVPRPQARRVRVVALGSSLTQCVVGALLWVMAQQVGSLACTGLGYWLVFDALGIMFFHVVRSETQDRMKRPYG